jgi:hypothetical protein
VQVAITQTNPAVLLWLHETFGGSLLHCVNRDHKYDYNFYELQWRGISSAGLFLKRVLPYLREKREQAELFLTYNTDMDSETRRQLAYDLKMMKGRNKYANVEHGLQTDVPGGESNG